MSSDDAPPSYDESNQNRTYSRPAAPAPPGAPPGAPSGAPPGSNSTGPASNSDKPPQLNWDQEKDYKPDVKHHYEQTEEYPKKGPPPPGTSSNGPPPNVTYVQPQKVNITQANPQHLDPAYPQFLEKEQHKRSHGYQDPYYKHGAPLAPGHKGKSSGGFPGSSGATYFNAANK